MDDPFGGWEGERPKGRMPIEALKTQSEAWFRGGRVARTFLSSGTTRADRSRSHFSTDGLELYRGASVSVFLHVLGRVFGTERPEAVAGISLVPTVAEWPDSSLAQMIAWIADVAPVEYCDEATLAAAIERRRREGRPVWVFGTAFHLLNAIDAGAARALPPGSVVVETGGTKGKAREVTRAQLFAEVAAAFGIGEARIVSEYGMCELASQAYDWVEGGDERAGGARAFRFPSWVRVEVMTGPGESAAAGEGVLAVRDPLRVDYPWALRTEDMACVQTDGSFRLLGRVPASPLKGCSLRAEQVVEDGATAGAPAAVPATVEVANDTDGLRKRATEMHQAFGALLQDTRLTAALERELGSSNAAKSAVQDLARSAPRTVDAWVDAARRAAPGCVAQRWLVILPQNHSLVGFHPLLVGYVAGLSLTVRVPERYAVDDGNAVALMLGMLPGVQVLPPAWRLGAGSDEEQEFDAVLAYGSDETIATLRRKTAKAVRGFGDRMGMTWLHASGAHAPSDDDLRAVAADALGVAQAGCMSTRLVVASGIQSEAEADALAQRLARAGAEFWGETLPVRARAALDVEAWRYEEIGFRAVRAESARSPLVVTRALRADDDVTRLVAARPFTLPVVTASDENAERFVKTTLASLLATGRFGTLTHAREHGESLTKSRYGVLSFRAFGEANMPAWDGTHEGRPLFG